MNIIDIGIIILLAFGAIIGFKRGFTTELVKALSFVLVVVLAFIFIKNTYTEEQLETDRNLYPLKRYGDPEEIAYSIIFFYYGHI